MAVSNGIISLLIALIMTFFSILPGNSFEARSAETQAETEAALGAPDSEIALPDETALDADAAWALIGQAQEAYSAGDDEQAIALLRQAGSSADAEVRMVCANSLMILGDAEGADPILQALIASDPETYFALRYDRVGLLFELGRTDEANALLEESLALRPGDADNILSYANAVYMHLDVPVAMEILDGLIPSHPELGGLLVLKSWLLSEQWQYADALAAIQQAFALAKAQNEDLLWYYWQQYDVQKQMGDFAQALRSLNRALSPSDDMGSYLERVDLQLWHLHNLPAALEDLDALARKYGNDAQILYLRTLVHLRMEQFEQAHADAAAMTEGDEAFALLMEGICALYEEKAEPAAKALDAFLTQFPEDLAGLLHRALLAISLEDDLPVAAALAQRAIAADPQSADAYRLLGEAYQGMGQWTQAEAAYRQAIDLASEDPFPALYLTSLLLAWNRTDDALAVLETAERQYPNWNATLSARMNYLLAREDYAPVLEIVKDYQKRFVSLAEGMELLEASLLAATGAREDSIALYEKNLEAPDPFVYCQYAYGLLLLGEHEQAAEALEAGTALLDASEEAPAIQRLQRVQLLVTGAELAQEQGRSQEAMALLEQACALRWIPLEANLSPQLKALIPTDEFQSLLARYPVE